MTTERSGFKPCGFVICWAKSSGPIVKTLWGRIPSEEEDRWVVLRKHANIYPTREEAEAVAVVLAARFPRKIGEIRIVTMIR